MIRLEPTVVAILLAQARTIKQISLANRSQSCRGRLDGLNVALCNCGEQNWLVVKRV